MPDRTTDSHRVQAVDLSNCEREPIHIPGRVQDYGCLLAVSADWMITHASLNCETLLGQGPGALVGSRMADLFPARTVHDLRARMQLMGYMHDVVRLFAYPLFGDDRSFDVSISSSGGHCIFEFEPRADGLRRPDDALAVQALIRRVQRHDRIEEMAKEAARGLRALSGFDRVMVYRFEADDSGTVIAEAKAPDMEPFLGLRYPASDIPRQAREMYVRSPLRIIADVDAPTHAILPERDPNGDALDLTMAVTRAVSPIHLEYLRNMGVAASMSVSILRKGKLWGLFACHHGEPRHIDYEKRTSVELFSQLFNYELAQNLVDAEIADSEMARNLHDRMMSQLSSGQSIATAFDTFADDIRAVIPFDGAAIYSDGAFTAIGQAPTKEEFAGLARFLNTTPAAHIFATDHLVDRYPAAEAFADRAAGLLALPISRTPRDYLVLFRREIAKSVNWAGNPEKPVEVGPNGSRLTPRKSFEAWQEVVRNHSAPWKPRELRAADELRVTLLEVVLKMSDESNLARKRAADQQELLIAELNHRVRNILNLIRGLVARGKEDAMSIEAYQSVLDKRIHALARAHDQLTRTEWNWVSFSELVQTEVQAFLSGKKQRVHLTGDEIEMTPTAFTNMALVIHELVTNSAKYGALSDSGGSVRLKVEMQPDGTAAIGWRERGGPAVRAPSRSGFGTTIIERSVPYELKGTADLRFRVSGVEADFTLPAQHVRRSAAAAQRPAAATASQDDDVRLSGAALVLEDNMIIALDAVDMLTDLGASDVVMAGSVADALTAIDGADFEFALLDLNLGDELSTPVIERCRAEGIKICLATGYGATADVLEQFPGLRILTKPYTESHVRAALAEMLADD